MTVANIVTSLDRDEHLHLGRLLILLLAFDRNETAPAIEGITKLAKLDFLLRYPAYFEKAMIARKVSARRIPIEPYERNTIEAQMVRYRFGPWDHRYRRFLNVLAAKRLIQFDTDGRAIKISLTAIGKKIAQQLAQHESSKPTFDRARLLKENIDIGPTDIMRFIYKTFPEIESLAYDEAIQ